MKLKVLKLSVFILGTCLLTGFYVDLSISENSQKSNLCIQNIEALANDEDISARVDCSGTGNKHCPLDNKSTYDEIKVVY